MAQSLRLRKVHVVRSRMKAARIISPGRYEVFEEAVPPVARGRVRVRLLKAALCGSDLPYFSNSYNPSGYPFPSGYPGHECMGVVDGPNAMNSNRASVSCIILRRSMRTRSTISPILAPSEAPGDGDMNVLHDAASRRCVALRVSHRQAERQKCRDNGTGFRRAAFHRTYEKFRRGNHHRGRSS